MPEKVNHERVENFNLVSPRRPIHIHTEHLKLTKTEYYCYKWDSLKHLLWSKLGRYCWFINLPNIASLLFIFLMLHLIMRAENGPLTEYGLVRVDRSFPSIKEIKEIDFRMDMIMEQQERIKDYANNEIQSLRRQLESSVNNLKQDIFTDLKKIKEFAQTANMSQARFLDVVNMLETNVTTKIENLYSELANISSIITKTNSVVNETVLRETIDRLENNFTSKFETLRSAVHLPNLGVNLASRKIGAKAIPCLSSKQFSYTSFVHRFSAFFYAQDMLDWPITERTVMHTGEAFCFNGDQGFYTIQLAAKKAIKTVLYEHEFWTEIVPISSPKEYEVWTCAEDCTDESSYTLAASCKYSSEETPAQTCTLKENELEVEFVRFKILSNHGQSYTCLYSVRIYTQ